MQRGASSLTPGRGRHHALLTVALTTILSLVGYVFPLSATADDNSTEADVSVDTGAPSAAGIGDVLTYTLTIQQAGPDEGAGISLVDRVDPSVDVVSATASQGSCTLGERIHCDLGELAAGDSATVTITGMATKAATVRNRAEVDGSGHDPDLNNNVSVHTTEIGSPQVHSKRFVASDDASIYRKAPNRRFGQHTSLEADRKALKKFLLRFDVRGLKQRRVLSATLRLYSVGRSPDGGSVHAMTDTSWSERNVSWTGAPGHAPGPIGSIGTVDEGKWFEVDVTEAVLGEGAVSFAIQSGDTDGADYASRNGQRRYAPQLIVTLIDNTQ